jgi:Inner membrane component of T3SS, cytoplasmic domain
MHADHHAKTPTRAGEGLARRTFTIGRDPSCDVVLADETVAREHARLEIVGDDGHFILSDCGQAPATKIVHHGEARPIRRAIVTLEDSVRFGDIEMSMPELIEALSYKTPIESLLQSPEQRKPDQRPSDHQTPDPRVAEPQRAPEVPPSSSAILLPCGRCGKMTDSLKRHRLHNWVVFIWIAWWAQTADYTACPSCMRAILLERTLVNIPGANLAWPVIFIVNMVHYIATFSRGHGSRVRKELLR